MSLRLGELGERWLLDCILARLRRFGNNGLGDDAASISLEGASVATIDMVVASTDMPPGMNMLEFGFKAITSSVSDLAAKGAYPVYYLVSLGLRRDMLPAEALSLWSGIELAVDLYGGRIVGGDINESNDVLIDCFSAGVCPLGRPLPRSGAKPGDLVATTGLFGAHAAGLHASLEGKFDELSVKLKDLCFNPRARVREGVALAKSGVVSSMTDSSDGLAPSLYDIAEGSGVSIIVDRPPIHPLAYRYASVNGVDLCELVFHGGEEYELVFTFPVDSLEDIRSIASLAGFSVHVIGRVVGKGGSVKAIWRGEEVKLDRRGWSHLKSTSTN